MEWYLALLLIFGSLAVLMISGLPVAFCFMVVNLIGVFLFWGGEVGLTQLILSLKSSVAMFALLPLPLFVLMGEVLFHSGAGPVMLDAIGKWMGRLPGRLSLLAVGGGALFSTLTGADMASVAILGTTLTPEMEKRGYKKAMSMGPILGAGGLAIMVPPSGLAVLLGAIGRISVGKILMGIIVPGVLMATLYAAYIILRCLLQPSIAPSYKVPPTSILEKLVSTVRNVLPVGVVIFMVIGVIFLGIATPTEAAATGALGCFILAAIYRKLNWEMVKKSIGGALGINVMILLIICGAIAFSQNLVLSGASRGLVQTVTGLPIAPIFILIIMLGSTLILGCFMEMGSMMMITIPLYMPIVHTLGLDPVWFAVMYLLAITMAGISPPFGISLFTMKGVAPPDTTIGDVYQAALPFFGLDLLAIGLLMAFPMISLWLPAMTS